MQVYRSRIAAITGPRHSGIWTLHFENGQAEPLPSGHGMRALMGCLDVDRPEGLIGQELIYAKDPYITGYDALIFMTPAEWEENYALPIPLDGSIEISDDTWAE